MSPDKLAYMANQIANFFKTRPHEEALAGIADHISSFWEPRMRAQFFELLKTDTEKFDPLVREAGARVRPVSHV
ncbi:formate dehydrogenase subunit delta [uncultured Roseibium sp.]|uniref:formate dehydrogenase subunit delta n=1 Tax=uncultured Roseibium sp. TaxID=1936171 RepID=UPI00321683AB